MIAVRHAELSDVDAPDRDLGEELMWIVIDLDRT